jgi:cytochrome c peroxidase
MGSFGWDDRRHEMHDPATFPLFESNEMANTSQVVVLRTGARRRTRRASGTCSAQHLLQ